MKIVVYQCCNSEQRKAGEKALRLAWTDQKGSYYAEPVSMGGVADWKVAEVFTYQSSESQAINYVEFVYVYRGEKPDPSTWAFIAYRNSHPAQSLEIQISEVGSNFLNWVANIDGSKPEVGKYILSYGIDENGISHTRVEPWMTTDVVELTPHGEAKVPFSRIDISLNQIKAVSTVPAIAVD